MLRKRAEEIINSKGIINVTYKNNPVWLEQINDESESANVKIINSNKHLEVPISDLNE